MLLALVPVALTGSTVRALQQLLLLLLLLATSYRAHQCIRLYVVDNYVLVTPDVPSNSSVSLTSVVSSRQDDSWLVSKARTVLCRLLDISGASQNHTGSVGLDPASEGGIGREARLAQLLTRLGYICGCFLVFESSSTTALAMRGYMLERGQLRVDYVRYAWLFSALPALGYFLLTLVCFDCRRCLLWTPPPPMHVLTGGVMRRVYNDGRGETGEGVGGGTRLGGGTDDVERGRGVRLSRLLGIRG
jgi:hypothetical protein